MLFAKSMERRRLLYAAYHAPSDVPTVRRVAHILRDLPFFTILTRNPGIDSHEWHASSVRPPNV